MDTMDAVDTPEPDDTGTDHTGHDGEALRRAMLTAVADLAPPPRFTEAVLRGGRRRRTRRRALVAGACGLVAVAVLTPWLRPAPDGWREPARPAEDLYDTSLLRAPTRGDLAGDREYLDRVLLAWQEGLRTSPNRDNPSGDRLTGSPKVVWAGTTPEGPAAVVAQGGELNGTISGPDGAAPPKLHPAFGLVVGADPELVVDTPLFRGQPPAFLFGPGDRTLLALDRGVPMSVSTWAIGPDGRGGRTWRELPAVDGVAVARLPGGADPRSARVILGTPGTDPRPTRIVLGDPATDRPAPGITPLAASLAHLGVDRQSKPVPQRTLDWPRDPVMRVAGATGAPLPEVDRVLLDAGMADPYGVASVTGFQVVADLPGGRTATGFEFVPDHTGSRFYVAITRGAEVLSVHHGGALDPAAPLPARAALPDGLGTLVAHHGAHLRYRTAPDAAWVAAGRDAALLPATATQVEVTRPGRQVAVVDL